MTRDELDAIHEDLRAMLADRLNIRARSFDKAIRKAGRLLPARARAAADRLQTLEQRIKHPKLAARTDPALLREDAQTIRDALARHRPGARAARDRSFLLADIGVKLALVIGLGLALVHSQFGI